MPLQFPRSQQKVKMTRMLTASLNRSMLKSRSTGTEHTSAKARLTNAAIWRISISSIFMSVNHFPCLEIVTNPKNNPCMKTVIRIATKIL